MNFCAMHAFLMSALFVTCAFSASTACAQACMADRLTQKPVMIGASWRRALSTCRLRAAVVSMDKGMDTDTDGDNVIYMCISA